MTVLRSICLVITDHFLLSLSLSLSLFLLSSSPRSWCQQSLAASPRQLRRPSKNLWPTMPRTSHPCWISSPVYRSWISLTVTLPPSPRELTTISSSWTPAPLYNWCKSKYQLVSCCCIIACVKKYTSWMQLGSLLIRGNVSCYEHR